MNNIHETNRILHKYAPKRREHLNFCISIEVKGSDLRRMCTEIKNKAGFCAHWENMELPKYENPANSKNRQGKSKRNTENKGE